jgi:hypothetical protein
MEGIRMGLNMKEKQAVTREYKERWSWAKDVVHQTIL